MASATNRTRLIRKKKQAGKGRRRKAALRRGTTKSEKALFGSVLKK